nr:MAG TPA: hypothetical protein [Bacteriophage sp.]
MIDFMCMSSQLIDSHAVRSHAKTDLAGIKLLLGTPPPDKVIVTPPMFVPDIDPKSYFSSDIATFFLSWSSLSHDKMRKDI